MKREPDIKALLADVTSLPDHRVDLARAALIVAMSEYADLDVETYFGRIESFAARLRNALTGLHSPEENIAAINTLLFTEEGFRGNSDDYYDPRNSFLNEVIDRRLGIPITLSILYIEVGRRAGIPLYGIGLPGHFIVGLSTGTDRMYIDVFNGGRILSVQDCRELTQAYWTDSRPFDRRVLDPVWPRQILVRLMRNLKAIYWQTESQEQAWRMIEWILTIDPDSVVELRERGFLREAIGDPAGAVADFSRYLFLAPETDDSESVRQRIEALKMEKTVVH